MTKLFTNTNLTPTELTKDLPLTTVPIPLTTTNPLLLIPTLINNLLVNITVTNLKPPLTNLEDIPPIIPLEEIKLIITTNKKII